MNNMRIFAAAIAVAFASAAHAQSVLGQWQEPGGSRIEVFRCGPDVCARLIAIQADAPTHVDAHNPDPTLRTRSLCGLEIGQGFHPADPAHAEEGKLYDPKSGKTYSGSLTAEGDKLKLRGYVGVKLFGRSETWTRVSGPISACSAKPS